MLMKAEINKSVIVKQTLLQLTAFCAYRDSRGP